MRIDSLSVQDTDQANLKIREYIEIQLDAKSLIKIFVEKSFFLKMEIEKLCLPQLKKMKKNFLKWVQKTCTKLTVNSINH